MKKCIDENGEVVELSRRKRACDEKDPYSCGIGTNYEDFYGYDTLPQCLKGHCCDQKIQDVPDLKCELDNVELNVPFKLNECFPQGWIQNNDDCWLDSALYSMFGTTGLADFFSNLLHQFINNKDENIKNFGTNIRKYLVGLTDRDFSCSEITDDGRNNASLCKQFYKNKIVHDISQILINLFGEEEILMEYRFGNYGGDIDSGDVSDLFKTIADLSNDFSVTPITFIDPSTNFKCFNQIPVKCTNEIKDRKFIKSVVDKLKTYDTQDEIVIFDIKGVSPITCRDVSRLTELSLASSKHSKYELLGIVFGIGVHYTSAVKCPRGKGDWRLYDTGVSIPPTCDKNTLTSANPVGIVNKDTFNNSEQVVLIYRKQTDGVLEGGSIFNMITNPVTGRKVNIKSKLGSSILRKYIKFSKTKKIKG